MNIKEMVMVFFFLLPGSVVAKVVLTPLDIDLERSELTFTAYVLNAPSTGEFQQFDALIAFDPQHLEESYAKVTVEMNSVVAAYADVADTLKSADWFNVEVFPQAVMETQSFEHVKDNNYRAQALLTLRDQTHPIVIEFATVLTDGVVMAFSGKTRFQRLLFDVGLGEWQDTSAVANEVDVAFYLPVGL